jgi:hypothetical protein
MLGIFYKWEAPKIKAVTNYMRPLITFRLQALYPATPNRGEELAAQVFLTMLKVGGYKARAYNYQMPFAETREK